MTSRERVLTVLRGGIPDRVPVLYWLNPHAACRLIATYRPARRAAVTRAARWMWGRFLRGGGMEAGELTRLLPFLLREYANAEYALELGADVALVNPELARTGSFAGSLRRRGGRMAIRGPFGVPMGLGGIYLEVLENPVRDARDLPRHPLPPVHPEHFDGIRRFRDAHPDACLAAECVSFVQVLCDYVLGGLRFYTALHDHPAEIAAFLQRLADWVAAIIRHEARAGADLVFLQDDYGATGATLLSPAMWAETVLPHLKRLIGEGHDAGLPFMLHSCGYQMPLLPYYAEAGLDALQSLQPKAGNDFRAAFGAFGDRMTFATGIDVQRGELMGPDELETDIRRACAVAAGRGRHVLAMTHMMQFTMPEPNFRRIFDTVSDLQAHGPEGRRCVCPDAASATA